MGVTTLKLFREKDSHFRTKSPPIEVAILIYNAPGAEAPGRYINRKLLRNLRD